MLLMGRIRGEKEHKKTIRAHLLILLFSELDN